MTEVSQLSVIVPSERVARAVAAAPGLAPVYVPSGGPTLSEPRRRAPDATPKVPFHTPPARAIVVDNQSWSDIAGIVAQVPTLELVQTLTAGVDLLRGVPDHLLVSNARGAHGPSTAEMAMALLLSVRREMPRWWRGQTEGAWLAPTDFPPSLVGERILVLGAGDLAQEFAVRARAFGALVTLVGRTARPGVAAATDLPTLLPGHGVVVVTVSSNADTYRLVNEPFLRTMPDGAILVNVARGPVVDTAALVAELNRGRLRAALDVTDPEPLPPDHPLWRAPGVVISPHVGGATAGVAERALKVAVAQLLQFASGQRPSNTIPRGDLR
jgi:phosphoglycerate dehydrogenase-like enzyme